MTLDAAIYAMGVVSAGSGCLAEFDDYVFGPGADADEIPAFDVSPYECRRGFVAPTPVVDDDRVRSAVRVVTAGLTGSASDAHWIDQGTPRELGFIICCAEEILSGERAGIAEEIMGAPADGMIALGTCSSFMPAVLDVARRWQRGEDVMSEGQGSPPEQMLRGSPLVPPAVLQRYLGHKQDWTRLSFCNTACSASTEAVLRAAIGVSTGQCAWALAGGVEILNEVLHAGFDMSKVLTNSPCRPFSRRRRGFQIGEGAGLVLVASPQRFGPGYLARIVGVGAGLDGHHLTAPDPHGGGLRVALTHALSGLDSELGGVLAHGTGTTHNDSTEVAIYHELLGDPALQEEMPLTSLKSRLGHSLGAAGIHNVVAAVLALRRGELPGTRNLEDPITTASQSASPNPQPLRGESVLTAAAAFGGHNAALVLEGAG